jgi:hypothetical protein
MDYESTMNGLANKAETITNSKIGRKRQYDEEEETYSARWNKFYHDTVDRLASAAGVRGTRKYPTFKPLTMRG